MGKTQRLKKRIRELEEQVEWLTGERERLAEEVLSVLSGKRPASIRYDKELIRMLGKWFDKKEEWQK